MGVQFLKRLKLLFEALTFFIVLFVRFAPVSFSKVLFKELVELLFAQIVAVVDVDLVVENLQLNVELFRFFVFVKPEDVCQIYRIPAVLTGDVIAVLSPRLPQNNEN